MRVRGQIVATQYTMQDRDRNLEKTYSYHKSHPFESMTEHISVNRDDLALEFFAWRAKQPFPEGDDEQMLGRFEEDKFGRELEPAAHGMLGFAVRYRREHMRRPFDSVFESEEEQDRIEQQALDLPSVQGERMEARLIRLCGAAGLKLPEDKAKKGLVSMGTPLPVEQREVRMPYRDDDDEQALREPGRDDDEEEPDLWMEKEGP